jgi:hypothetical protein
MSKSEQDMIVEFMVTVIALVVGFIVGKKVSKFMMAKGVPISAAS